MGHKAYLHKKPFTVSESIEFLIQNSGDTLFKKVCTSKANKIEILKNVMGFISISLLITSSILLIGNADFYVNLSTAVVLAVFLVIHLALSALEKSLRDEVFSSWEVVRKLEEREFMHSLISIAPNHLHEKIYRISSSSYTLKDYKLTYQQLRNFVLIETPVEKNSKTPKTKGVLVISQKLDEEHQGSTLKVSKKQIDKWQQQKPFVGYFYDKNENEHIKSSTDTIRKE